MGRPDSSWMLRRCGLKVVLLLAPLFCLLAAEAGHSQDPAAAREKLVAAVEVRAQKDLDLDRPLASASDLAVLFGEDANAVGLPLADLLSVYEAAYQKARNQRPWWKKLKSGSWLIGLAAAILAILWTFSQKTLEKFFEWLGRSLYSVVARFRPFWWLALRQYRQALVRTHKELKIPFRPGRPLSMVEIFVPLKVNGAGRTELVEAEAALSQHRRLVVVGDPGAGKTMLMRHLALTYAREGLKDFLGQPIPILVELHRLNEAGQDLIQHLAVALDRMDFPNAAGFVSSGLEKGLFLLLFDGLDEVNRDSRNRVVLQIKDLTRKAPNCRVVVTCRSAAYNNEFAGWSDQNLEVVEFDDQQIQRFLSAWATEMPWDKSVEHLVTTLSERPRILALARNPLLLTIIAYLYCDTLFVLPHSRAAFYKHSTNLLLEQWDNFHQRGNHFRASHKQVVLRVLALFFQERAHEAQQDRRSATLAEVLLVIRRVLPSLNLEAQHAEPLLDEIVERSGLILALDGRRRFQFSHLTLQQFFAALDLEFHAGKLVKFLEKDPEIWRETAKLWCGLDHDSTVFLRQVISFDPLTALECLGDTQKVDAVFADQLIESFRRRLGNEGVEAAATREALSMVAADFRPWGVRLREALIANLADPATPQNVRQAVAQVLSRTHLPQAAEALALRSIVNPDLRPHLLGMGDMGVGPLVHWVTQGVEDAGWAIELLTSIGTPKAVSALVELLWSAAPKVQRQAAWNLGTLLPRPGVERTLRSLILSPEQRADTAFNWIWEPFESDPDSPLRVVVGRIAALIESTPLSEIPDWGSRLDPRLAYNREARQLAQVRKNPEKLFQEYVRLLGELQVKNTELEQERDRRAKAERDAVWKDFAVWVGHKLGNPLDAISRFLQPLDTRLREGRKEEALEILAKLHAPVENARDYVRQLKSLARDLAPKPKNLRLRPLLDEVFATVNAEGVSVEIDCPETLEVLADPTQLREVFEELAANSICRLDKAEKRILVRATRDLKASKIGIIFEDNGPGVPREAKKKIFDVGYTTGSHGGSGIGLAIVRRIVEGHGGQVTEFGGEGLGACFAIELPQ